MKKKKIVIGVSGASGSIYAIRLLQVLKEIPEVEVHGTVSDWAYENIRLETNLKKCGCLFKGRKKTAPCSKRNTTFYTSFGKFIKTITNGGSYYSSNACFLQSS